MARSGGNCSMVLQYLRQLPDIRGAVILYDGAATITRASIDPQVAPSFAAGGVHANGIFRVTKAKVMRRRLGDAADPQWMRVMVVLDGQGVAQKGSRPVVYPGADTCCVVPARATQGRGTGCRARC